MEENSQQVIDSLKSKIKKILALYEALLIENQNLSNKMITYKTEIDQYKLKTKELENKIGKLQLIEAFKASSQDVKEAKQKIGKLVQEIDKCIEMLND